MTKYIAILLSFATISLLTCSCLSSQEQRLLRIMEESGKTEEANQIRKQFAGKQFNKAYEKTIHNLSPVDSLSFMPQHFILNPSKDTCIIIYSVDIPASVIHEIYMSDPENFIFKNSSHIQPYVELFKMACVYDINTWSIIRTTNYIYEYDGLRKGVVSDTIVQDCIDGLIGLSFFMPYKAVYEMNS